MLVRMWATGTLLSGGIAKEYSHFETVWQFLIELNTLLRWLKDDAPWYLPKGPRNLRPLKSPGMFIAALLITAKTWKQPGCPLKGRWINCTTLECLSFSTKKKEQTIKKKKAWRNLKRTLSEGSQSEKATYCTIPTIWRSGKRKTMDSLKKKKSVVAKVDV